MILSTKRDAISGDIKTAKRLFAEIENDPNEPGPKSLKYVQLVEKTRAQLHTFLQDLIPKSDPDALILLKLSVNEICGGERGQFLHQIVFKLLPEDNYPQMSEALYIYRNTFILDEKIITRINMYWLGFCKITTDFSMDYKKINITLNF